MDLNIKTNEKVEVVEFKDDVIIRKFKISIEFEDRINKIKNMNLVNNNILNEALNSYLNEHTKYLNVNEGERINEHYNTEINNSFEFVDENEELIENVKKIDDFLVINILHYMLILYI